MKTKQVAFRPRVETNKQIEYIQKYLGSTKSYALIYSIHLMYHFEVCNYVCTTENYCPKCGVKMVGLKGD